MVRSSPILSALLFALCALMLLAQKAQAGIDVRASQVRCLLHSDFWLPFTSHQKLVRRVRDELDLKVVLGFEQALFEGCDLMIGIRHDPNEPKPALGLIDVKFAQLFSGTQDGMHRVELLQTLGGGEPRGIEFFVDYDQRPLRPVGPDGASVSGAATTFMLSADASLIEAANQRVFLSVTTFLDGDEEHVFSVIKTLLGE